MIGVISILIGLLVFITGTTLITKVYRPSKIELATILPSTEEQEILEILHDEGVSNTRYGSFHKNYIRPQLEKNPQTKAKLSHLLGVNIDELNSKIKEARLDKVFTAEEVLSMRVLGILGTLVFSIMGISLGNILLLAISVMPLLVGALLPVSKINGKIKERNEQLESDLPDFLDLLYSVTEAGLVIQDALEKVTVRMRGPLAEAFRGVMIETKTVGWVTAMANLSFKQDSEPLSDVISDILIAHEKGTSIKDVLKKDAEIMRKLKNSKSQEQAKSLSIKILIPMAIFGFMPLFALIIAPMMIQLMSSL